VASYWPTDVKSVRKVGADSIRFAFDTPHPGFGWVVSNAGNLFVTSKAFYQKAKTYGSPDDLIDGTGPYRPVEFQPDSHVTLEPNPHYSGPDKATLKKLRLDFVEDENTRLLAFRNGDDAVALSVPADQQSDWKSVPGASVRFQSDRSYYGLTFNPNNAPFDDVHVRRALSHLVDKRAIVTGILKGKATAATGLTSPDQLGSEVGVTKAAKLSAALPQYAYSVDQAKDELAKSRHKGGFTATLTYPDSYSNVGKASLAIAQEAKKIGITIDVKQVPLSKWLQGVSDGSQGIAWMIYGPTTGSPTEIADWLLATDPASAKQGSNPAYYASTQVAAKLAAADTTEDPDEQVRSVLAANAIAQRDAIYTPVFWGQSGTAFGRGFSAKGFDSAYFFSTVWANAFLASPAASSK
jgi:peptide/nickel transport system substrate-binding protein